jgi:hypothetical protein
MLANMVGFRLDNKQNVVEFLPKNEQLNSEKKRRAIFFNLYNYYVDQEMRLTKVEIKNGANIYEVFQNKIASLSCCTHVSPVLFKLNVNTHNIRFHHGCNNQENTLKLRKKFENLVKLGSNAELFFDLDDMFLHLVYERAKKVNPKGNVVLLEKSILIIDQRENVSSSLLIPSYLKLERESINFNSKIKEQMEEACKTLNETEKIKQVYLIYPKHPKFMKHINVDLHDKVRLRDEEYRVKMIPYSFSFCTKDKVPNRIKNRNLKQENDRCQ